MSIWNEIDLKKPPLFTVNNQKLSQDDLVNLKKTLEDAITFYENQTEFDQASALCSRLIARRKNSFNKMYGFKSLTKLNSSVCRLLKVDIKTNLKNFLGMMPEFISINITKNQVPTKANFEYLLLKLLALHKLYERISFCARETADYFTKLIHHNYFFDTLTLLLATVSNLWTMSNEIGIFTTHLYTNILIYRKDFPLGKETNFNKEEFIFPKTLNYSFGPDNTYKQKDGTKNIEAENFSKNIKFVLNDFKEGKCPETIKDNNKILNFTNAELIFNKNLRNKLNINEIKTTEDIKIFIQEENNERKKNLKKCITKKISENDWKKSIKDILNKITLNDNKNAIKTFKYTIKNKI